MNDLVDMFHVNMVEIFMDEGGTQRFQHHLGAFKDQDYLPYKISMNKGFYVILDEHHQVVAETSISHISQVVASAHYVASVFGTLFDVTEEGLLKTYKAFVQDKYVTMSLVSNGILSNAT